MTDLTRQLLQHDEGVRADMYHDTKGCRTIGIGHNLDASPPCDMVVSLQQSAGLPVDNDWLPESIEAQYSHDLPANASWLWGKPWWGACSDERKAALNDMAFNLGPEKMQTFTTFLGLCAAGDWEAAANDLMNTLVAKELPVRYYRISRILLTGTWPTLPAIIP